MKPDLTQLRRKCPLPALMQKLGMARFVKSSCASPFRADQKPSWGIFQTNGRWMYKDFSTGECGDEIGLLAHVYQQDQQRDFVKLLDLYAEVANRTVNQPEPALIKPAPPNAKPDTSILTRPTDEQIGKLSDLRKISVEGLQYASERNVLKFGQWHGHEVFAVTDQSRCLAEMRRLDGQVFAGYGSLGPHKSHTLKNSRKNWPLGVLEADGCEAVALVEGMPDFLAMHQFVVEENMIGKITPVAMLTSSCEIAAEALPCFAGKTVRIFPHLDQPGIDAAERWQMQLINAKATVDFFNFRAFEIAAGSGVKDLCDFNRQRAMAGFQEHILGISTL